MRGLLWLALGAIPLLFKKDEDAAPAPGPGRTTGGGGEGYEGAGRSFELPPGGRSNGAARGGSGGSGSGGSGGGGSGGGGSGGIEGRPAYGVAGVMGARDAPRSRSSGGVQQNVTPAWARDLQAKGTLPSWVEAFKAGDPSELFWTGLRARVLEQIPDFPTWAQIVTRSEQARATPAGQAHRGTEWDRDIRQVIEVATLPVIQRATWHASEVRFVVPDPGPGAREAERVLNSVYYWLVETPRQLAGDPAVLQAVELARAFWQSVLDLASTVPGVRLPSWDSLLTEERVAIVDRIAQLGHVPSIAEASAVISLVLDRVLGRSPAALLARSVLGL